MSKKKKENKNVGFALGELFWAKHKCATVELMSRVKWKNVECGEEAMDCIKYLMQDALANISAAEDYLRE